MKQDGIGGEIAGTNRFCGKDFSKRVADPHPFPSRDDMGGREDKSVRGNKRAGADPASLVVLDLDKGAGDFRIEVSQTHAIGSEHGCERSGERVSKLARAFEGDFCLGKFSLMKKAAAKDSLNLGVLRGDEDGVAGGFFSLGVSTGEVEGPGFEFAGLGVVFVPPEGLRGGNEGSGVSAGRPKFFFRRKSDERKKGGKEKKEKFHAVKVRR